MAPKEKSDTENWREEGYVGKARKEMAIPPPPAPPSEASSEIEIREMCPGKGTGKTKGKPGGNPLLSQQAVSTLVFAKSTEESRLFSRYIFLPFGHFWETGHFSYFLNLDDRSTDSDPEVTYFPYFFSNIVLSLFPPSPVCGARRWRSRAGNQGT